ncbi:MAG: helix-turn-helix domain-containing protein, partial [Acidimicrobiia bacterium]|nr:helix-turn-helix domain-containing protein [Acidimicrobiia bacterium]
IAIAAMGIDGSRVLCLDVEMAPASSQPLEVQRLVEALQVMEEAAASNAERSQEVRRRARRLRKKLEGGQAPTDVVQDEDRPRTVELLSANMETLETAGAELRAAQALALRADGMTIAAIAELFGVTRQRISALLRQKAAVTN